MNREKISIGSFVLIAAMVFSAISGLAINRSRASQIGGVSDLTKLNAVDISAFRWIAMADFYAANSERTGGANVDLTTFDAAEISAYRWNAMARFYEKQAFLANSDSTE